MKKIIFQNMITVDGFFEGAGKEIDWHNVDEEFNEYAINFLNSVDTLLFGKITYQLMANYWPTPAAVKDDPIVAGKMNSLSKVVISKTLRDVKWNNSRLIKKNVSEEISKLKKKPGKDIAIFGSSDLAIELVQKNLIDEFRILINPILLGNGKRILEGVKEKIRLQLLGTKKFKSGNILLTYIPA